MGIATNKGLAKWMEFKAEQNAADRRMKMQIMADDRRMKMQVQYDAMKQGWDESAQRRQEKEALLRTNPEQYASMYPYEKRTKSLQPYLKFQREQQEREFKQVSEKNKMQAQLAMADDNRNFYLSTMNSAANAASAGNAEMSNQIIENAKRINPNAFTPSVSAGKALPFVGKGQGVIENAPPGLPATAPGTFIDSLPSPTEAPPPPSKPPKGYTEKVGNKLIRYEPTTYNSRTKQWDWRTMDVTGTAAKPERKKTYSEAMKIWNDLKAGIAIRQGLTKEDFSNGLTESQSAKYRKARDDAWSQFEHKYAFKRKDTEEKVDKGKNLPGLTIK